MRRGSRSNRIRRYGYPPTRSRRRIRPYRSRSVRSIRAQALDKRTAQKAFDDAQRIGEDIIQLFKKLEQVIKPLTGYSEIASRAKSALRGAQNWDLEEASDIEITLEDWIMDQE